MANADTPFGLRPVMMLDGSPWNGQGIRCVFASGDSTATFIGDPVKLAGSSVGGYPTVQQAAAGNPIFGVVVAFEPDRSDLTVQYRKASTERQAIVVPARDALFVVQEDSVGGALTADSVGQNADIVVGSGNTTFGISGVELDSSGAAAASAQLKILGLWQSEDNAIGTNAKWLVKVNESGLADANAGV